MIPPQLRDSLTTPSIIGSSLKTESINNIQLDHSLDNIVIDPSVSGNCSYLSPPKSSCDSFSTPYPRFGPLLSQRPPKVHFDYSLYQYWI